jgi:hypothetical protein
MGSVTKEAMQSLDATMKKWFDEHAADYKEARIYPVEEFVASHPRSSPTVCATDSIRR